MTVKQLLHDKVNKERMIRYVMDNSDNSHSLMASWCSYCIYDGRIYSYSDCSCCNCCTSKNNQREKTTLIKKIVISLRA